MDTMLKLLASLLELRHLLLHLLPSLSFVMQLFFELLNATECLLQSPCHVAMSGMLSDASVEDLYSLVLSMMLLSMLLIDD